jgi:hypothetical protein
MGGTDESDDRNGAFGLPERLVDHKPGVEPGGGPRTADSDERGGDNRFHPAPNKQVPQGSLASRIRKPGKGT